MTQIEMKDWLDWFRAINNKVTMWATDDNSIYHDYHGIGCLAYQPVGEAVRLQGNLQLVLQEEIARQGWTFELETYQFLSPSCIIRCKRKDAKTVVKMFSFEADTILEAVMGAFRKAWEATK